MDGAGRLDATGTILVPDSQAEFAEAVINEIEVEDEVPDSSPEAYIVRIEEHLCVVGCPPRRTAHPLERTPTEEFAARPRFVAQM